MKQYFNSTMYLLYHMYYYGKNNEHEEIKTLGIYSTEQQAMEAVERYYRLEGFRRFPKECFCIDKYRVNVDTNWSEGFVSTDDLDRDFETLTVCFNEWLCNNQNPHESWKNKEYYNALCDVNTVIYKMNDITELAEYIQSVWMKRFPDRSKSFDEYIEIANRIILIGFYKLYD